MNDSSNICLACGLCCDGTMIGHVQVDKEELLAVKDVMEIEEAIGNGFFLQPCAKYCDGCTIYSNRPSPCASFKCKLLKSIEQQELEFDMAVEIINVVKQKKMAIEEKLSMLVLELKSKSFFFKIVELNLLLRKIEAESSLSKNQQALNLDIKELEHLLLPKFGISF